MQHTHYWHKHTMHNTCASFRFLMKLEQKTQKQNKCKYVPTSLVYADAYTCTHTHAHTRMHMHTHAHAHTCTCTHMHTTTHTHTRTHMHKIIYIDTHTHTHMHKIMYVDTLMMELKNTSRSVIQVGFGHRRAPLRKTWKKDTPTLTHKYAMGYNIRSMFTVKCDKYYENIV